MDIPWQYVLRFNVVKLADWLGFSLRFDTRQLLSSMLWRIRASRRSI